MSVEVEGSFEEVAFRLTGLSPGGGCSCKLSPGELEGLLELAYADAGATSPRSFGSGRIPSAELVCGLESGDDATVVRLPNGTALVMTTDFFPPVVDDPYDWGRIAAANAVSDVYAMGGEPVSGLNLLAWPSGSLDAELAAAVLRGGRSVAEEGGFILAGGHSVVHDTPMYGLAVTGVADPDRLLRNDRARVGDPITLTKPLGLGVLNNRHKETGEYFTEAVSVMSSLNRDAARSALGSGVQAATDVTGFGLLGHLYKMVRASGVAAIIDSSAVPYLRGAREALADGFVPGGTRRNLDWVRPHLSSSPSVPESELLLLADAQTSGGLLVCGEIPGWPVVGEIVAREGPALVVR